MHASVKQNMIKATVSPGPHDRRETQKDGNKGCGNGVKDREGLQIRLNKEIIMCTTSVVYKMKKTISMRGSRKLFEIFEYTFFKN